MPDKNRIDPIGFAPIVDDNKGATTFFAAQWQKLVGIAIEAKVTAQNALNAITKATTLESRQVIAGTGLSGGGDLSADVTLNLADTAVTPGSFTNTDLTVDQQGRITAAASGAGGVFTGLTDTPSSYVGQAGKIPSVNVGETALEFVAAGGGTFISLTDTPTTYTGQANRLVRVNSAATALEFVAGETVFQVFAIGTGVPQGITLPISGLSDQQVVVTVNGLRFETDEYSIAGTTLTLTTNASGDSIEVVGPVGGVGTVFQVFAIGTGGSQDITLPVSGLTDQQVLVAVNGLRFETDEYSIAGDVLTLTTNASGDSIEVIGQLGGLSGGGGGAAWTLVETWTHSVNTPTVEFLNLGVYSDIMIIARGLTTSSSTQRKVQFSSDNGATWDAIPGNYPIIDINGVETAFNNAVFPQGGLSSAARSFVLRISNFNQATTKFTGVLQGDFMSIYTDPVALDALRVLLNAAGNITGGSIEVFGRVS